MSETRICTSCGEELPATREYFYADKSIKCGLASKCKKCRLLQMAKRREEHMEDVRRISRESAARHREYNKARGKTYYAENKEKIKERNANHYINNKDVINARNKAYRESNAAKEKARCKRYRTSERGKFINLRGTHRRDDLIKSLPITLTPEEWDGCKEYFEYKCAYCGKKKKLAVEHFIPANKGGELSKINTVPACITCNSSKGTKSFFEWYPKQPFYSKERELKILNYLNYDPKTHIQQLALTI